MTLTVGLLRDLLMEIGQIQYNTMTDELRVVGNNNLVYTLFGRIVDVIGVWSHSDVAKAADLYGSSGSTDGHRVSLGTSTDAGTYVLVSYVIADGLNENAAKEMINQARYQVLIQLNDDSINLDVPVTNLDHLARSYWIMLTLYGSYLLLNNVNFIQGDANLSLFNYQYSSKLWGEGMSTDALFMRLWIKLNELRKDLFMELDIANVYVSEGSPNTYWTDDSMLKGWLSGVYTTSVNEDALYSAVRSDQG